MVQNPALFNLEVQFGWLPENQTKNNLMVSCDLESTQVFRHQAVVNVDCVFINAVFGKQQHQLNKDECQKWQLCQLPCSCLFVVFNSNIPVLSQCSCLLWTVKLLYLARTNQMAAQINVPIVRPLSDICGHYICVILADGHISHISRL